MKKNVAGQKIGAQMVSATDGSAFTGAVAVYVCGDAGSQGAGSVGSGACTHEGNGYHTYAPSDAETNYDLIAFTFVGTGAVGATVQVFTTYPQTGDNFARLGAPAGASVSADIADLPTVTEFNARTLAAADYTVVSDLPVAPDNASITAILEDTGTTLDALIKDVPTVAEFEARTLVAANYFDPAADVVAHVTLVDTTTTNTDLSGVNTAIADVPTVAEFTARTLPTADYATATALTAVDAVTDKIDTALVLDGAVYQFTANALELAPAGGGSGLDAAGVRAAVGLAAANLDTQLNAIVADTGELQADWADGGRLDLILDAAGSAGDPWITTLPGAYTGNQAGAILDAIRDVTDAIDVSAVTVTAANDAGVLTVIQSVTFSATVSGLTISATWAKLYWTLKESIYDDDDEAILQLVESNPGAGTDGLLYLDSAAIVSPITVADGTLTVNQAGGTVAIVVSDNATTLLSAASDLVWDIKTKDAAGATVQNTTGTASIVRAVTQTI